MRFYWEGSIGNGPLGFGEVLLGRVTEGPLGKVNWGGFIGEDQLGRVHWEGFFEDRPLGRNQLGRVH